MLCAKTVTSGVYSRLPEVKSTHSIPLSESWLYPTRLQPIPKNPSKDAFEYSEDGPEWFKIKDSKLVKEHEIEQSQGFDGTVTILSRISGWITVSPNSRNRQKRLGRYGPFDKSKKGNNYQNVSDLAPAWMQTEAQRHEDTPFKNTIAPANVRKEQKRVFLFEKEQTPKSVFSYGDFRHNVSTAEEAKQYSSGLLQSPSRLIEWKEDIDKQRFDKPITSKVGSRY